MPESVADSPRSDPKHEPAHVYLVVRHTDDVTSVHLTREGANERMLAFMVGYGDEYEWSEETLVPGLAPTWLKVMRTHHDDGPSVRLERVELEP